MMNLAQAANAFIKIGVLYNAGIHDALDHACIVVKEEAKRVIGTYDYGWPQLADATKADRVSKGFTENEPLLRTGDLQKSIDHIVHGRSGHVGSDDDKAVWQELGTVKIPPRSFLMQAAVHKEKEIVQELAQELVVRRLLKGP